VVRAGLRAVETEGAIEIARLDWQKQLELATTLAGIAPQTVFRLAIRAHGRKPDLHLERRDQRAREGELADRAGILAEARPDHQPVDEKCSDEIGDYEPCGGAGSVPDAESLLADEEGREKPHGEPFRAQRARPGARGPYQPPAQLARQHERAGHAEE